MIYLEFFQFSGCFRFEVPAVPAPYTPWKLTWLTGKTPFLIGNTLTSSLMVDFPPAFSRKRDFGGVADPLCQDTSGNRLQSPTRTRRRFEASFWKSSSSWWCVFLSWKKNTSGNARKSVSNKKKHPKDGNLLNPITFGQNIFSKK